MFVFRLVFMFVCVSNLCLLVCMSTLQVIRGLGAGKRVKMEAKSTGRSKPENIEEVLRDIMLLRLQLSQGVMSSAQVTITEGVNLANKLTTEGWDLLEALTKLDVPTLTKISLESFAGGSTENNLKAIMPLMFKECRNLKVLSEQVTLLSSLLNAALYSHYVVAYFEGGNFVNVNFKAAITSLIKVKPLMTTSADAPMGGAAP